MCIICSGLLQSAFELTYGSLNLALSCLVCGCMLYSMYVDIRFIISVDIIM